MQKGVAVAYHRLLYFILFIYHYYFFWKTFFCKHLSKCAVKACRQLYVKIKKSKLAIARFLDFFLSQLLLEMEYIKYHIR